MSYHDSMEWLGRVDEHLVGGLLQVLEERHSQPWRHAAACRDEPMAVFFPPRGSGAAERARAQATCAGCPVRAECLAASRTGRAVCIWAGEGDGDRRLRNREDSQVA